MIKNWFKNIFSGEKGSCDCECQSQTTNLSQAASGKPLKIECLKGEEKVCERLREMGFCESSVVEKIADSGALICKVCDAKVILSKGLAKNVMVKEAVTCAADEAAEGKLMLLSQLHVGQRGMIVDYFFADEGLERIQEMGLTPHETVEMIRYAPLGDPIEVKVRGYCLSLRKQEADQIKVKSLP